MQKTRTLQTIVFSTVFGAILLGGCLPGSQSKTPAATPTTNPATSTEKSGTTTVRGTLQVQGKTAVLKTPTATIGLESYDVDFAPFNGKSVSVTGKYSGDTLYVSSITE